MRAIVDAVAKVRPERDDLRPARLSLRWLGRRGVGRRAGRARRRGGARPGELPPGTVAAELLNLMPGVDLDSGLTEREIAIVTELRLPRVVLGLLVGAMLALAGGCYQGVFRNPLADPYLLGVAAGAGLGVTAAIAHVRRPGRSLPLAAFAGAVDRGRAHLPAGAAGGRDRSPATLILAGVAVSAFLAAGQTYLLQRNVDTIREVYSWLLGRLATAGWHDVQLLLPYAVVTTRRGAGTAPGAGRAQRRRRRGGEPGPAPAALPADPAGRRLAGHRGGGLRVGPDRLRRHHRAAHRPAARRAGYRSILPLSLLFGAAFLALADLVARTADRPGRDPDRRGHRVLRRAVLRARAAQREVG